MGSSPAAKSRPRLVAAGSSPLRTFQPEPMSAIDPSTQSPAGGVESKYETYFLDAKMVKLEQEFDFRSPTHMPRTLLLLLDAMSNFGFPDPFQDSIRVPPLQSPKDKSQTEE